VIGEGGRRRYENQVMAIEQLHDLLAHGRQESSERVVVFREAATARTWAQQTRVRWRPRQTKHLVPSPGTVQFQTTTMAGRSLRCRAVARAAMAPAPAAARGDFGGLSNSRADPSHPRNGNEYRTTRFLHGNVVGPGRVRAERRRRAGSMLHMT
jgi:hypothetical protein